MKSPLLTLTLATLMLVGCGSDSNNTEPETPQPPPVENAVNIDEATQINLKLEQFDSSTGTIQFSLTNAQQEAITAAKTYDIYYFGFPDKAKESSNPKACVRPRS